ncbi:hypothetical protein EVG20_g8533 [Dentipellis fragilis]|uniref:Uncharacterized protein n=1 Tax=Dentipellis fragilis TaxID=205917 RepID=A0A4Y9Y542_9AGAM|nr:hypothetical protein EVG20_g8533 [Dentipellis fragilis]
MQFFTLITAALTLVAGAAAEITCENRKTLSSSQIGQDKNVQLQHVHCSNAIKPTGEDIQLRDVEFLGKRQTNVCGATCNTNCFTPSGNGPNPYDCQVIQDALLYDSQNVGPLFTMDPAANTSLIVMQYASCETFIVNQTNRTLEYCRSDWASLTEYIAFNCQSTQNAHGGNCVASDQQWFVQYVFSSLLRT